MFNSFLSPIGRLHRPESTAAKANEAAPESRIERPLQRWNRRL